MPDPVYLKLKDDVGLDPDGKPGPLVTIGLAVDVPAMHGTEVIDVTHGYTVNPADKLGELSARIIPDTRIVESQDYRVNAALLQSGNWEQVDSPTKAALDKAAKETKDSREGMKRFGPDGYEIEPRADVSVAVPDLPNDQPGEGE